jgi:hypothetical protein
MRSLRPEILADFLLSRDQLGNGSRRLGAALNPSFCLFLVDFKCSAAGDGIIRSDLLDVSAVAGKPLVADDDAVKGPFLSPVSAQTNSYTHTLLTSSFS